MTDVYRNPETTPQDEKFEPRNLDPADYPHEHAGPGGTTTLIENNERGILQAVVFRTMDTYKQAELGSNHDSHAQGIYSTNGGGKYSD